MSDILSKALKEHGSDDVTISYQDVAKAFPSEDPHPDSFDHKLIDENQFLAWAKENLWEVKKLPEEAENKNSPPIRFTKIK
ncbi:MAG: hypothetical protein K6L75_08115 [Cellvibrionaceae bacterium]